jgi:hypothetical protein
VALPDLIFGIRGQDRSGQAFRSARRNIGDTRRQVGMLNADVRAATASLTGLGKSALIGITGVAGMSAAIHKMKAGLSDFDRIAKTARQSGLDGEFYQTIAFMAGEASVEVSTLDTALRKFTIGVGQAADGTGTLYTELKRSNPELLKILLNTGSAEERLRIYADAVRNASSAEQRASLVAAGFGQRGAELVRVLELGADAMDDAGNRARELGNIIEDDVLDQAEAMQNRLGNASDALDKQLKAAMIEISPVMVNFYENSASVVKFLREMGDEASSAAQALTDLGNSSAFKSLRDGLADAGLLDPNGWWNFGTNEKWRKQVKEELKKRAELRSGFSTGETFGEGDPWIGDVSVLPRSKPSLPSTRRPWTDPASRSKATKDAERQEAQYQRVIEALNREQAALSKTSLEQRIANEQVRAGVAEKSEQGKAIAAVVTRIEQERKAQEALNERLQFFGELGAGAFSDLISGAESFEGVMRRVGLSIADAALQAAIFGQGPLANLLGLQATGTSSFGGLLGLFDGFFAGGGSLGAGRWGIAGEAGYPEVVTGPAKVWTPADLAAVAGHSGASGGQSRLVVSLGPGLEASILDQAAGQSIEIVEDYDERRAPATARAAVAGANRSSTRREFRQ